MKETNMKTRRVPMYEPTLNEKLYDKTKEIERLQAKLEVLKITNHGYKPFNDIQPYLSQEGKLAVASDYLNWLITNHTFAIYEVVK
jgi:hypothetical protein